MALKALKDAIELSVSKLPKIEDNNQPSFDEEGD
jgi:hypothetical protein